MKKKALTTKINYSGKVTLKTTQGKKILQTHNEGALPLFRFLSLCLAGDYTTAERARPFRIRLFYDSDYDSTGATKAAVLDENKAVSGFISVNTAPTVFDENLVLHFIIPYSNITGSKVNLICLYGLEESEVENYSAKFYIDGGGITVDSALSNLSLLID